MQAAGALADYAIGGAVAAFLYIEPGATFDLDVFTVREAGAGGLLTSEPLYEYLLEHGYGEYEKEAVIIEGWAVQFLPAGTPLVPEALTEAVNIQIKGIPTRVFTMEHLMAICLQTGRPKDIARLLQFVEHTHADMARFAQILSSGTLPLCVMKLYPIQDIFAAKDERRKRLANLSIDEKVDLIEKLHEPGADHAGGSGRLPESQRRD